MAEGLSQPRRWTLKVCPDCGNHKTEFALCEHQRGDPEGPMPNNKAETVRVVEDDGSLDRALDLLEHAHSESGPRRAGTDLPFREWLERIDELLRAHGRLGGDGG